MIPMNNVEEDIRKVALIVGNNIAYYNLSLALVQYQFCAHKLNRSLIRVVKVLDIGFRIAERPINLLALEYIHQLKVKDLEL